ncbi:hypothetical protein CKO33_05315 [Ectothiorhodospira mobilis]|nr:hypothetical protein [Ectothiorhodospira mobilis]
MLSRIAIMLVFWAVLTIFVFYFLQRYKSERASLIGGLAFLVGAIAAVLLLPVFFGIQECCNTYVCIQNKEMVSALVTFFIISWGSFGANLISACVSHK